MLFRFVVVVGLITLLSGCLSVGGGPGPADADVTVDTGPPDGGPEPDGGPNDAGEEVDASCKASELMTFQCADDLAAVEVCTDNGWTFATACDDGRACYASPLEAFATCAPLFDCYDTTVYYLSCDFSGLPLTDRDACKQACTAHSADDVYKSVLNCYDAVGCNEGLNPYGCVIDHCETELIECLGVLEFTGARDPIGQGSECGILATCYSTCPDACEAECEGLNDFGVCRAQCHSECRVVCRQSVSPDGRKAYFEWGVCQLALCGTLSGAEQQACIWANCAREAVTCVGTNDDGGVGCIETFECVRAALDAGFSAVMGCVQDASSSEMERALELLACVEAESDTDGACRSQYAPDSEAFEACVAAACAGLSAACQ